MFAEDKAADERSPIDFTTPLASSPLMRNMDFREPGESSRGAQENNQIYAEKYGIKRREMKYSREIQRRCI